MTPADPRPQPGEVSLREIVASSQHQGESQRRWFTSAEQDLYVWQGDEGEIVAFQLCYDKSRNEHALYWRSDRGYAHLRVDDGEASSFSSETPILLADGACDIAAVRRRFLALADALPDDVCRCVLARLDSWSGA